MASFQIELVLRLLDDARRQLLEGIDKRQALDLPTEGIRPSSARPHNGDAVADVEHSVELVSDEEDGAPFRPEPLEQRRAEADNVKSLLAYIDAD